jgi:drug/metabolite transporter (DMT)-like permease
MNGPLLALFSAALFGISPVVAKTLIGDMSPALLAGLLYLGSGLVLLAVNPRRAFEEVRSLNPKQKWKLAGAIVSGGIIAPLFLTYGISRGSAFEVSLLLNLETVATTLIAALIFREHVGSRVWLGKAFLVGGAILLTLQPSGTGNAFSVGSLLVIGACFFWGIDNNLTRDIEELRPSVLAGTKGLSSGVFNVTLAITLGIGQITLSQVAGSLTLGAVSYGASLVLFVLALRKLGSSRTSTYFSSGPFIGMLGAVLFLGEKPNAAQWLSSLLMGIGVWVLIREKHEHEHAHEPIAHSHRHVHDEHHQHLHEGSEGPEPHDHFHIHDPVTHTHRHVPDIHHRHSH